MSDKVQFVILQRVDLMTANPTLVYEQALERYNGGAHEWRVHVVANSRPVDLTGCTVSCYAARSDKKTVYVKGKVSGSVASCEFDAAFYAINGDVAARMELSNSAGQVMAVARMCCTVSQTGTDTVIDPGGTIPSLDNLMALLDEMASATKAANDAAAAAYAAAGAAINAPYIDAETQHWMTWNTVAGAYVDTGVMATGWKGDPGEDGDDGITPHIGANGNWFVGSTDTGVKAQGPAGQNGTGSGTVTGIRIGDTVYQPDASGVVLIENVGGDSLPAGGAAGQILAKKTGADGDAEWVDPPEGTLKSVCGKEADEDGDVDLTASDVGAVSIPNEDDPTYGVATGINADMLGGVPASSYAKKSEIPAAATGLPAGGSAGQVLAKKSDTDGDVEWKDDNAGGGASYDQSLNKADNVTFNSVTTVQPINAGKLGGKEASAYVLAENFEEWTFTLDDGTTVKKKVIVVD